MSIALPPALTSADQDRFTELVRQASGIEVPDVRRSELEHAVQESMKATGAADTSALFNFLAGESGRAALEGLVAALTIGETYFFRDRAQFNALTQHILPELIERRRATRQLRVWSAGCASGEEAYSLAILIEWLLPDLDQWQLLILATDINRQSLAKAQRGLYSPWSFRDVPPDVQGAFFTPHGREFEIVPRLRQRVTFAYLNLVEDGYPSLLNHTHTMDLIVFRNVLIYFRPAAARLVLGRLHSTLAEGGWLVVGHADPSPALSAPFGVRNFPGTVVYKKDTEKEREKDKSKVKKRTGSLRMAPRGTGTLVARPAPRGTGKLVARPAAPAPRPAAMPVASDPFAEAFSLWKRGRMDDALRLLTALAAAEPRNARAPYLAARIHANQQHLAEAKALVDEALRRAPLHAPAHYLLGLILQETGQPEPALAALRRCVYADPQFVLGHFALANLLAQTGQPDRARKAWDNVEAWLATHPRDELLAEGDGLTAGRLTELIAAQKELREVIKERA